MKTFKHKVINGQYKTLQEFQEAYTNHIKDWNDVSTSQSLADFLGLTFSEFCIFSDNVEKAWLQYLNKQLFNIPSIENLIELCNSYFTQSENKDLRFGQYVFNVTNFEFRNSYEIQSINEAYTLLVEGIEYWNNTNG